MQDEQNGGVVLLVLERRVDVEGDRSSVGHAQQLPCVPRPIENSVHESFLAYL